MTLSTTVVFVVATGAFAGGFVSGLAGFGTGLIALGFWLHVLDSATAATLVAVCSVVGQVQTLPSIWPAFDAKRAWPIVLAGLIGIPLGTFVLTRVDLNSFRLGIGLFLLVFAGFMLFGRVQAKLTWGGRLADSAVGFAGGFLGGLAGLSGPLPVVWATLRGWSKDERRGVIQVFNSAILSAVVLWHFVSGLFTLELGWLILIALPGTLAGTWLGLRAYRRLSDRRFHEIVLCLLAISGLSLVWSSR